MERGARGARQAGLHPCARERRQCAFVLRTGVERARARGVHVGACGCGPGVPHGGALWDVRPVHVQQEQRERPAARRERGPAALSPACAQARPLTPGHRLRQAARGRRGGKAHHTDVCALTAYLTSWPSVAAAALPLPLAWSAPADGAACAASRPEDRIRIRVRNRTGDAAGEEERARRCIVRRRPLASCLFHWASSACNSKK